MITTFVSSCRTTRCGSPSLLGEYGVVFKVGEIVLVSTVEQYVGGRLEVGLGRAFVLSKVAPPRRSHCNWSCLLIAPCESIEQAAIQGDIFVFYTSRPGSAKLFDSAGHDCFTAHIISLMKQRSDIASHIDCIASLAIAIVIQIECEQLKLQQQLSPKLKHTGESQKVKTGSPCVYLLIRKRYSCSDGAIL